MDFKKLADQAKSAVDKRGGTESLKEDLGELKDIAKSKGSLADKAKEAAAAIKDPGDAGDSPSAAPVTGAQRGQGADPGPGGRRSRASRQAPRPGAPPARAAVVDEGRRPRRPCPR